MHNPYVNTDVTGTLAGYFGISAAFLLPIFIIAALWTIVLKGFALWHSARGGQRNWFIFMLIVNALGIPELVYLVWFRKDTQASETPSLFDEPKSGTVAESPAVADDQQA
jgi:Family of unknown function (DUF5652)